MNTELSPDDVAYLASIEDITEGMKSFEEIRALAKGCPDPARYSESARQPMRVTNYDFVFDDWDARRGWFYFGWRCVYENGLPYVQFHVIAFHLAAWVQCDPCSEDEDRTAYTAMVRTDLELALARARARLEN